jgi:hypothetical protein
VKIFLEMATFVNRAPLDNLELTFEENVISILSSANGKGKTTVFSHIVDALYEMARPYFVNDFEGRENKYYRVSSPLNNLDMGKPSFVYLRFRLPESNIDYVDIGGHCTENQYNEAIQIEGKIPYAKFSEELRKAGCAKKISSNLDRDVAENVFSKNIVTSFPSYRFEVPGYLNDPYQVSLDFRKTNAFSRTLRNPIEVVSGLPLFANWVMDVVLDLRTSNDKENQIPFANLNSVISQILSTKGGSELRFGIGPRGTGGARIQIVEQGSNGRQVYPSIFNLSSGESSLLCLFGELLRQADNVRNNVKPDEITGICLVDEVDKHLHINLQKEVLPSLLRMFPNVQFILSSHSPFLSLGLAEKLQKRSRLFDIERGIAIQPIYDKQYCAVYEMMLHENEKYKMSYESILSRTESGKELQIITEGKNTEHIEKAISVLDPSLLERGSFVTGAEGHSGDQQLKSAFVIMASAKHSDRFLFVWDCDSIAKAESLTEGATVFKFCFSRNEDNRKATKGIENLYPEGLFTEDLYDKKVTETSYGGSKTERVFSKSRFLEMIKGHDVAPIFDKYRALIDKIISIMKTTG